MIELGRNLYSNVRVENVKKKVSEKVRAIVIGSCGSGKTKLFNNLCNTKNPTKFSKGSVTRDITY
jgi:Ni2+-binding GTPase involved in maturation of urease and hydrogenase